MFNPLKSIGDWKKIRDRAIEMQRQLEDAEVVVEKNGVRVKMTGTQKIKELSVDGQPDRRLVEVLNEAIKRSQEIAAKKLAGLGGIGWGKL